MTESVTITMLGAPCPWARTSGGRSTHLFTPAKQRRNAQTLATLAQIEMRDRKPFEGPVRVDLHAVFEVPRSWSRIKQTRALCRELYPAKRPDLSNLLKQVEDSLNRVVFVDDSLIVETTMRKVYGEQPKIVVTVSEIDPARMDP
jgi:Holliday junction resolvase RusA-like endonuclease